MKNQLFFVPGPLPNLNEMIAAAKGYNGRGFAYSKMKQEWSDLVIERIKKAKIQPVEVCVIAFQWREKNKRRDPDNVCAGMKFCLDGLVKAGIIGGDGWKYIRGFEHSWYLDKHEPGVLVEIRPR